MIVSGDLQWHLCLHTGVDTTSVRVVPSNTIANPSAAMSVTSKPMESSTQQKVKTGTCGREGFQWERLEQQRQQLLRYLLGVGPGPELELTALGCQQSFL